MANICSNKFYITSDEPEIIQKVCDKLNKLFETTLDGEIDFSDEYIIEGFFDSRWNFPAHIFENFFDEFNDSSLYMRCLSEEYGCDLVSMSIYSENQWKPTQYFDL